MCWMSARMYLSVVHRKNERTKKNTHKPTEHRGRCIFFVCSLTSSLRYAGRLLICRAAAGEERLHYSSRISYIACATCWMLEPHPHPQQLTLVGAWLCCMSVVEVLMHEWDTSTTSLPFPDCFGRWLSVDDWWSRWSLVVVIFRRFHVSSVPFHFSFIRINNKLRNTYWDRTDYFLASRFLAFSYVLSTTCIKSISHIIPPTAVW